MPVSQLGALTFVDSEGGQSKRVLQGKLCQGWWEAQNHSARGKYGVGADYLACAWVMERKFLDGEADRGFMTEDT